MINFVTTDKGFTAEGITTFTEIPSQFFKQFTETDWIYADTEDTGLDCYTDKVLLLVMESTEDLPTWVIDCRTVEITPILQQFKHKNWVFHNAQFDVMMLGWKTKVVLPNVHCTLTNEKLIDNRDDLDDPFSEFSLAVLVKKYFDIKLAKEVRNSFINKPDIEPFSPEEVRYAAADTKYLSQLMVLQEVEIKNQQLTYLVYLERKFLICAIRMMFVGVKFNTTKWRNNIKANKEELIRFDGLLRDEIKNLAKTFPKLLNQRYKKYVPKGIIEAEADKQLSLFDAFDENAVLNQINFNSDQHILKIFEACGEKIPSTGAELLKKYVLEHPKTSLRHFIELLVGDDGTHTPCYKFYEKQISTYGEKFIKQHVKNLSGVPRIHTTFGMIETKTGRLNSKNPNLQNIPAIKRFREAFVADNGYEIYTIDYSGCELSVCAFQSNCPTVKASINEGVDLHSLMATISYRIITGDPTFVVSSSVNKDLRTRHKRVLFGLLYGAGASRIAQVLQIEISVARIVLKALQKALPVLFTYLEKSATFAVQNKYIFSNERTNRKLYFKDVYKEDYKIEKEAKNYRMQATNADLVKEAICVCQAWIDANNIDCKILMTVHDEIVFQAPIGQRWIADKLIELMESVGQNYVPGVNLRCECDIFSSWTKGLKKEEQITYFEQNPSKGELSNVEKHVLV